MIIFTLWMVLIHNIAALPGMVGLKKEKLKNLRAIQDAKDSISMGAVKNYFGMGI